MSGVITVTVLAPRVFNPNGDAENGRVLVRRLRWAGLEARLDTGDSASEFAGETDAFVIGACPESEMSTALETLREWRGALRDHLAAERPLLAIGTGAELLGESIELAPGRELEGLGIVPLRAALLPERAVGELAVRGSEQIVSGYENHARGFVSVVRPLGRVLAGVGNGDGSEGAIVGSLLATHLHGPFTAKNPAQADALLAGIAARRGLLYSADSDETRRADGFAGDAQAAVLARLRVADS